MAELTSIQLTILLILRSILEKQQPIFMTQPERMDLNRII
jgi:hypothetical protein